MAKGGQSYDFSFLRTDSTDVGFMLDEVNGKKVYERFTDPALAQQFFTGSPDLGRLEPHKEISINQSSFEAGYGQEFFDDGDKKRYYHAKGVDARFRDNLICGPKATAIALPADVAAPSITDVGLELWDDASTLTNYTWVIDNNTPNFARDSFDQRSDTYCGRIQTGGSPGSGHFYQDLSWDDDYRGREFTFKAWCKTSNASEYRVEIDDGVGITTGTAHTGGGSYEQLTVTRTLAQTATKLRIKCAKYANNNNKVGFFDDLSLTLETGSGIGNPVAFADFNGELYIAAGAKLLKLNGTGDGFTNVARFTATITDLEPFVDDFLYICLGSTAANYYYMTTGEALTQTNSKAEYMVNVAGTMHKAILANKIYKATNPTSEANWGTVITVGSTFTDITDLINEIDVVYIGKEDMPYYLDTSDNDIPLIEDVQSLLKSTNCKNMIAWHRNIYVPVGEQSLAEYATDGTVTWRSPALFMTNLSDFNGRVQAVAGDEEYLFAILDNSAKLEIFAGQARVVDGTVIWGWFQIQQITLDGCETAFVSSVYKKRLWIASTSSSDSLYYIPLTTKYGDITSDSDYKFQTGGTLITPWYHSNLKADTKAYFSMTVASEGADGSNYITVDYQTYYTALTGTWANLGNFTTSPSQTRYFSSVTGRMIRFRFTIVTSSESTTPKMTGFDCRGIWRPTRRQLIGMVVKLGDEILTKDGSKSSQDYTSMKDAIVEATNKVWPNTFYDIDSWDNGTQTTKYCNLLYAREFDVVMTKGQRNPTSKFELMFEEITLS